MSCRQALSCFLLFVFTLISVPKELIHELHHHEDTSDTFCEVSLEGDAISEEHIHCDYLKFEVQPFGHNSIFVKVNIPLSFAALIHNEYNFFISLQDESIYLRGPPCFIA